MKDRDGHLVSLSLSISKLTYRYVYGQNYIGKRSQYDEILLELSSGQDVIRSGINPSILVGHLNNMSGKVCSGTRLLCTTQRMKKPLGKNVFSYAYLAR